MRDSEKFLARLNLGIEHNSKVACSVLMHEVFAFLYFQKASKNTPSALVLPAVVQLFCLVAVGLIWVSWGRRVQIIHIYLKIALFFSPEIFK